MAWIVPECVQGRRTPTYRAPSWSWASVDCPVSWDIDRYVQSEDGFLESAMNLIASNIFLNGPNPLGTVAGGSISVAARSQRIPDYLLVANEVLTYPRWMLRRTEHNSFYLDR